MALRKSGEAQAAVTEKQAEARDERAANVARAEFENDDQPVTDKVKVEATTALAATGSRAVSTQVKKFEAIFKDLQGVIPGEQAESLKRLKSAPGSVKDEDNYNYGSYVDLHLLSFFTQWVVSPGDDSSEAKEEVRYSYDGVTTTGGDSVEDHLASLKASDYPDASVKTYTVLVGILEGSQKGGGLEGDMVQVSLSPSSKKSFEGYRLQTGVKLIQGRLKEGTNVEQIRIEAENKTKGDNDFTLLKVVARP